MTKNLIINKSKKLNKVRAQKKLLAIIIKNTTFNLFKLLKIVAN